MADSDVQPILIDNRNLVARAVFETPPEKRPQEATIPGIADWLIGGARQHESAARVVDEFGWMLLAAGIPVLRVSLHAGTLHPQFLGATYLWWRDVAQTQEIMIRHEIADALPYPLNPVRRVIEGEETMRLRTDGPVEELRFGILRDLKARGATEYLALPVRGAMGGRNYMATFVTDRPGGFTEQHIADLTALAARLSVTADLHGQRSIADNVLKAYLGPNTGPRVLAGQIRRGSGEEVSAVLWSSDLRGFTRLSDHQPPERVIALLNELFDLQARAIADHGGEILKFMGDGLLAIFPVASAAEAGGAAANALAAAQETQSAMSALRERAQDEDSRLRIVVALHYGAVIYGNIGAAERLDFTVIGPAVNLVSRLEGVAKTLDLPLIVSDDFARAFGGELKSLGSHALRGLEKPHELFTPAA